MAVTMPMIVIVTMTMIVIVAMVVNVVMIVTVPVTMRVTVRDFIADVVTLFVTGVQIRSCQIPVSTAVTMFDPVVTMPLRHQTSTLLVTATDVSTTGTDDPIGPDPDLHQFQYVVRFPEF